MIELTTLAALIVGCALAQAFFISAEVAFGACDRHALRARASRGERSAIRAARMLEVPQVTFATTLVGANLATLVAVALVGHALVVRGESPLWAPCIGVPPLLVLGQLVPKAAVQGHADRLVGAIARPLRLASWLLRPVVAVVGGYAALITRVIRTDRKKAFVTRDELALLIESEPQTDQPEIGADEREMIANVFELSEYQVDELMVPLSEVTALPEEAPVSEAALELADKQHSRMPIYRSRIDDVVGVVHVFDILQAATEKSSAQTVADLAHSPLYVPETMKASDLLVQLQTDKQHLAVVVDEYGGAIGIVTVEDLLETIVGDIDDEHDASEPSQIMVERPGVWRIQARTPIGRLNAELGLSLPESDSYETIAGLVIERLGHIPDPGESLVVAGLVIEVVASSDRAIEVVRIARQS